MEIEIVLIVKLQIVRNKQHNILIFRIISISHYFDVPLQCLNHLECKHLILPFLKKIRGFGANSFFYSLCTVGLFSGIKRPECEADR
jgi:hypothetical protein